MINFIAKNIKFAHFWASNHRHRSASRMMNIERYGRVTPSITKGVSEKNVFKNQKINPKHLGSVNVSTALHRFYNRWFSVKVAGRPTGRTLPRRSSHRRPAPPKVGANDFLSKWTLLVGVTPLRRGSCRKSSRSSSSRGSTSSYFLPKNSQFLMVIAFSWTDFGDVFLAIFRRKIVRFWWLTNIAAYLSWIFDQNSSICYGYIKKTRRFGPVQVTP